MIKVYIKKQGSYPLSSPKLKRKLKKFLADKGIVSDADVSVYFSGKKEMKKLAKKYLGEDEMHNVLSFAPAEGDSNFTPSAARREPRASALGDEPPSRRRRDSAATEEETSSIRAGGVFIYPPGDVIHLGEVVICYPEVVEEAKRQGKMIDEKVYELAEHGAKHLLGEHHG